MKPIFTLQNLRKRRGGKLVLEIERLELLRGRIYALLGANGAGKSTLLQLLALLEKPSAGEIAYDGEPVNWGWKSVRRIRREVTLVHQSPYLFDTTVFGNLEFGLRLRRIGALERRRRIVTALQTVGMGDFEKSRARELSCGEMQRVALARALVLQPRVLLLDEPTANIDRDSAELFEKVLTELPGKGVTVIITSHDPDQHRRLGSEVIRLAAGRPVPVRPHLSPEYPHPVEGSPCLSPLKMQEV